MLHALFQEVMAVDRLAVVMFKQAYLCTGTTSCLSMSVCMLYTTAYATLCVVALELCFGSNALLHGAWRRLDLWSCLT